MTDLDLERLGDLWRQPPNARELEELKRSAEQVRRRARWLQVVDVVAALVVSGVVLWMVLANPAAETVVVGGGAIVVLLGSQVRSRRFRQQELRSLTGSAEQMLDQSIERVEASLKRARLGLILLPSAFLLGILVGSVTESRSRGPLREIVDSLPGLGPTMLFAALVGVAAALLLIVHNLRKNRRELDRLKALRATFSEEDKSASG